MVIVNRPNLIAKQFEIVIGGASARKNCRQGKQSRSPGWLCDLLWVH
jgi:hypothetical protein